MAALEKLPDTLGIMKQNAGRMSEIICFEKKDIKESIT